MTRMRVAAVLWLVAGLVYVIVEALVAAPIAGYTYGVDFISDLGRPDFSPRAGWMNVAFIQQGAAFLIAGVLVCSTTRPWSRTGVFVALAAVYGIGSAMVGLFHSAAGADQTAHLAGATAAIVGGNLALLTAGAIVFHHGGQRYGILSAALGAAGLVCAALLLLNGAADALVPFSGGFWERASVYTVIGWQMLSAVLLLRGQTIR